MDIVLSYNNMEEVITLPFIPEELPDMVNHTRNNEEFELINGINGVGKLNLAGLRELKTLTIETFFTTKYYPWAKSQKDGWQCVNTINNWMNNKRPIRIIITTNDGLEVLNMACLVDSFVYGVNQAGDIPYTLTLKEFPFPVVRRV
ncbi:hypothetical protein ACFSL6_24965 [Paenibacillus thailandensis]|uniref:Phage portal protein n=1 Tax=Paenibacillus thailandensis TaxID=393250 RepID=A0ABW5R2S7_9BACL